MLLQLSLIAAFHATPAQSAQAQLEWWACIQSTALRYAAGQERAEVVADSALENCAGAEAVATAAREARLKANGLRESKAITAAADRISADRIMYRRRAIASVLEARSKP